MVGRQALPVCWHCPINPSQRLDIIDIVVPRYQDSYDIDINDIVVPRYPSSNDWQVAGKGRHMFCVPRPGPVSAPWPDMSQSVMQGAVLLGQYGIVTKGEVLWGHHINIKQYKHAFQSLQSRLRLIKLEHSNALIDFHHFINLKN